MFLNNETDYAIRIISCLAESNDRVDAAGISEKTGVTLRFTLKILSKLVGGGIVASFKGSRGGYKLREAASNITLKRVIELIDGPIAIARCLEDHETCSMNSDKTACIYHHIFD